MKVLITSQLWTRFALIGSLLLSGCALISEQEPFFKAPKWSGQWQGVQPDYAMKDANGQAIYIQGQEAQVKSSTFTFIIQPNGGVSLTQSMEDGRVMEFEGRWNPLESSARTNQKTDQHSGLGINCELSASTGAYRNYILLADSVHRIVRCHGTPREPHFELTYTP